MERRRIGDILEGRGNMRYIGWKEKYEIYWKEGGIRYIGRKEEYEIYWKEGGI